MSAKEKQPERKKVDGEILLEISRVPRICPIYGCGDIIFPSSLLSHYLIKHAIDQQLQLREIFDSERVVVCFDPRKCELNKNACLGTLTYAGFKNEANTTPTERNLCFPNTGLSNAYQHLQQHLPVLIMICKTTWASLMSNKELGKSIEKKIENDETKHIYILWCISSPTTFKLHYTMTLYDKCFIHSRSCIRLIRDFNQEQDVHEFISNDSNYMLLTAADAELLGKSAGNCINMEIILHENQTVNIKMPTDFIDLS